MKSAIKATATKRLITTLVTAKINFISSILNSFLDYLFKRAAEK